MSGAQTDRAKAQALFPNVSRETWARLDVLVTHLQKWQKTINLVAPKTLDEVWVRHIADGLQILDIAPRSARVFVDLGSGGGFPGLVLAAVLVERQGAHVHLVESDQRKCAFLREAARAMNVEVTIHNARVEAALESWPHGADVVTARALAPLKKLIALAYPLLKAGTVGIFPKGQDVESELTEATKCWTLSLELVPSRTEGAARLAVVSEVTPR
ncbi:16S rRNA (guanine(527)-N(7))-methyltransferase RsmG [Terrihabitans soli]|nr:16S rRNA (guanine(527)-N(7))-methyltransferase RsmG [Terrihabitans soli]